ncbi:prenyltransferase [Halovivax asiaticus JCM 14624]|uniref:Digeranylgeranylglyceryl phosphate synthase n=1 Tax=Halovivax asiaticus JCM 14624 TaxID=1227490 RepID=M0BS70_9EURY|nr:geranylgeranylglycerol-phosphate geranylgeranyltransferase [Halovivax asiaticus]ELZ12509.1 prenyltransferase [Halovivax asiaticus JCM 14624]
MTAVETGRGLWELLRPVNAIAAAVLTAIGAFVAGGLVDAPLAVGAAAAATFFGTGAGNAINDYFDREIDAHNKPDRPIPRGAVSPRQALWYSLACFAAAVVLALTLPVLAIGIALFNLFALVSYTQVFKGLPGAGNVVVAYLGGSTFLFGAAAAGRIGPAVVLFALAALSTVSREIVKDVEDIAGDRAEGLNTLPIAIGERRALWIAVGVLAIAILASPIPYLTDTFGLAYLLVLVPAIAYMTYAAWTSLTDPARGQHHLKYGMFLAALAFVIGRLSASTSILA